MSHDHPGVQLLLLSGLVIYWLIPLSSWLMLRREGDRNARLWFTATGVYSLVATLYVFKSWTPELIGTPVMAGLGLASVLLMLESLRRELPAAAPRSLYGYGVLCGLDALLLVVLRLLEVPSAVGIGLHLTWISLAELVLVARANQVRQYHHSRAMGILMATFLAFAATNLIRVLEWLMTGRLSMLLDFTLISNASLITNYLSVIFYCYGYWGFVVEKSRSQLIKATEQAVQAKASEELALHREELMQNLLQERMRWMDQVAGIGKLAQLGALSATIAHEVNQPLAAIQLNIEESQRMARDSRTSEPLQHLLKRIESDNQRVAQIVQRIRGMFGVRPVSIQRQSLDDLVQTTVQMHSQRLQQGHVQVHLDLNASVAVEFASGEIEHVVMNLLDNAWDALQDLPRDNRHVHIQTWSSSHDIGLAVEDNGSGIPTDQRHAIFDLLGSSKSTGMGIGLWLARYIAERHGGTLELEDKPTPGARFVLRLPRVKHPESSSFE